MEYDDSAKPETKVYDNVGQDKICPFMSRAIMSGHKDYVACGQHRCMAWGCLGDFIEQVEGQLTRVRKWGCLIIHKER